MNGEKMEVMRYDFSQWHSYPSSLFLKSVTTPRKDYTLTQLTHITSGATIQAEVFFKWENNNKAEIPLIGIEWYDTTGVIVSTSALIHPLYNAFPDMYLPWTKITNVVRPLIPANAVMGKVIYKTGATIPGKVSNSWVDDLKIYQNGELIYSNDFNNWNPYVGAGVGALAGIPAYLIAKKRQKNKVIITAGATVAGVVVGTLIGFATAKP